MKKRISTHIFHGFSSRVQLTVFDFRQDGGDLTYTVYRLSSAHHPSTAFKKGILSYAGDDFKQVWYHVCNTAPDAKITKALTMIVGEDAAKKAIERVESTYAGPPRNNPFPYSASRAEGGDN